MQPSNAMLQELRAMAALGPGPDPLALVADPRMRPVAVAAYSLGKVDGRIQMTKRILEDLARGE